MYKNSFIYTQSKKFRKSSDSSPGSSSTICNFDFLYCAPQYYQITSSKNSCVVRVAPSSSSKSGLFHIQTVSCSTPRSGCSRTHKIINVFSCSRSSWSKTVLDFLNSGQVKRRGLKYYSSYTSSLQFCIWVTTGAFFSCYRAFYSYICIFKLGPPSLILHL